MRPWRLTYWWLSTTAEKESHIVLAHIPTSMLRYLKQMKVNVNTPFTVIIKYRHRKSNVLMFFHEREYHVCGPLILKVKLWGHTYRMTRTGACTSHTIPIGASGEAQISVMYWITSTAMAMRDLNDMDSSLKKNTKLYSTDTNAHVLRRVRAMMKLRLSLVCWGIITRRFTSNIWYGFSRGNLIGNHLGATRQAHIFSKGSPFRLPLLHFLGVSPGGLPRCK